MHDSEQIINGNLGKVILGLSVPVMISHLLQTADNLTDTFWVGRLGSEAIAAVTVSFPIFFLMISIAFGISLGGSILISHAAGNAYRAKKKDSEGINHVLSQSFVIVFLVILFIAIIGYLITPAVLRLIGLEDAVLSGATAYLRMIFLGFPLMAPLFVFYSSLIALGNTKTPMKFILAGVVINIIIDPILIFGIGPFPALGVFGAALATVISRGTISLISLYFLITGKYGLKLKLMKPELKTIREIMRIGIPSSVENGVKALSLFIQNSMLVVFGTAALAGFGIVIRMFSLFLIPSIAISTAVSTVVAQNIGAGNKERALQCVREGIKSGFWIMAVMSIVVFAFSRQIIQIFSDNHEVISIGSMLLLVIAPFLMLILLIEIYCGFFRGVKRTDLAMGVSILHNLFFRLGFAYVLAFSLGLGLLGIALSFPLMKIAGIILAYILFIKIKSGLKKKETCPEDLAVEGCVEIKS